MLRAVLVAPSHALAVFSARSFSPRSLHSTSPGGGVDFLPAGCGGGAGRLRPSVAVASSPILPFFVFVCVPWNSLDKQRVNGTSATFQPTSGAGAEEESGVVLNLPWPLQRGSSPPAASDQQEWAWA